MKRLRAAVVGVGYLGRFHAQKYQALASSLPMDLAFVCDLNAEQADKVGRELNVPALHRTSDLIGKVDIATIASTTQSHFMIGRELLTAGIHCNIEKPVTSLSSEASELCAIADRLGLKLSVGHSERFNPAFRKIKSDIAKPRRIELLRHATYKARGADVSVLHDLMVHDLDLLLQLASGPLELLQASGGKVVSDELDWASAQFSFGSSGSALISVSRIAPQMTRSLRVIGEQKSALANLQTGDVEIAKLQKTEPIPVETLNVGKGDNLLEETRGFVASVLGEKAETVSGVEGRDVLHWIEQLQARIGHPG